MRVAKALRLLTPKNLIGREREKDEPCLRAPSPARRQVSWNGDHPFQIFQIVGEALHLRLSFRQFLQVFWDAAVDLIRGLCRGRVRSDIGEQSGRG